MSSKQHLLKLISAIGGTAKQLVAIIALQERLVKRVAELEARVSQLEELQQQRDEAGL